MSETATPVVLVCTVGGSAKPVRESILSCHPTHIIYVVSQESSKTIFKDIETQIDWKWDLHARETVILKDFQNLLQCVMDIREGIPNALEKMSLPEETPLLADFTGGTKVMSAALTLAMMEFPHSTFSYVGGERRTKDGMGIVENGTEVVMRQANPWDVLALREVRALADSFNKSQFADAWNTATNLTNNIDNPDKKKFYNAIVDMVQGYMLWDAFDHKSALPKLRQSDGRLAPYAFASARIKKLLDALRQDIVRLETLQRDAQALLNNTKAEEDATDISNTTGKAYLLDLLANAQRRADAGHYDDAVARLYSAIEKCAKIALWQRHGIDNSDVPLDKVPPSLHDALHAMADDGGKIKIGLTKSFLLLAELGDPLGKAYLGQQKDLENTLSARNQSLLAHGYLPIDKDKYTKLFATALQFLDTRAEDLPAFPHMDWKALLL